MRFTICEFGGNATVVEANDRYEAVHKVIGENTKIYPDGYIHRDGEPFGWIIGD